jgi:hypothetical protein
MDTEVIVGIFTLAGVALGASLDYLFSERSRRRERIDIAKEETMDAVNEITIPLVGFSCHLRELKKASTQAKEKEEFENLLEIAGKERRCIMDLYKAYDKMSRYIKKGEPIHKHFSRLFEENYRFLDLATKFVMEYPKSKNSQLSEQLKNQMASLLKIRDEAFTALRGSR